MPMITAALVCLVGFVPAFGQTAPTGTAVPSGEVAPSLATPAGAPGVRGVIQYPALSPDGQTVVFSWLGDLWLAPASGGSAVRLTSHPAEERRAVFSPDGGQLAFESDRDGSRNLYVMGLTNRGPGVLPTPSGAIARVTTSDRAQGLSGWSSSGDALLYSEANVGIHRAGRMFSVPVAGGVPRLLTEAFGTSPRMSPDGGSVVFTRRRAEFTRPRYSGSAASDVWRLDVASGQFNQVTDAPATDADGHPMADGTVVFVSTRDGTGNIWRARADGSRARPLTKFAPTADEISIGHGVRDLAVNAKANRAVFVVWDQLMTLDLADENAKPVVVTVGAALDGLDAEQTRLNLAREVTEAVLSPDGKTVAQIARGEVFVRSTDENWPTRRVTATAGRERELAWSPDGRVLWFTSDEGGVNRPYYATVTLAREDLEEKPKSEPAAEKKDESKDEKKPEGDPKAEGATDPKPEVKSEVEKADDKPADSAAAKRPAREKKPDFGKRWAEAISFEVRPLDTAFITTGKNDGVMGMELTGPLPSPDGRSLLLTRGLGDLVLVDLVGKSARVLFEGWSAADVQWASDSRHVVFSREDLDFNSDVFLLDTALDRDGKPASAINLTKHPDLDDSPRLSADGKVLIFRSDRAGENFEFGLYAINLDRSLDAMRPYELEDYYKKQATAAKTRKPIDAVLWDSAEWTAKDAARDAKEKTRTAPKALTFDVGEAYLRVRRLSVGTASIGTVLATPACDRIVISQGADGPPPAEGSLSSISYKGDDRKAITTGAVRGVGLSLTGERVAFIKAGQASAAPLLGGKVDALTIDAPITLNIREQMRQKFTEAARVIGNGFYHNTLKGLDWPRLTQRYLPLAMMARTNSEFDRIFTLMLGELDGSHLGINGPDAFTPPSLSVGYLGVDVKQVPTGLEVTRAIDNGVSASHPRGPRVGDVITSIDDAPTAGRTLTALLISKAGRETLLTYTRAGVEKPTTILITPGSAGDDGDLRYKQEVLERRAKVEKMSGGKLGYLHIRGMSEPSVRDFERDLFAAASGKAGLIIDVRDNGGGSTADILLASLTAPVHAKTQPRGVDPATVPADTYPRDRRLIYSFSRPISVLINENSFSNAEIFAHAVQVINRGKLVGTATYGGVISTGGTTLIDGTSLRTPFRGWHLPDGRDQESNGAKPEIDVPALPQDEAAGKDAQLEAAVRDMLKTVK